MASHQSCQEENGTPAATPSKMADHFKDAFTPELFGLLKTNHGSIYQIVQYVWGKDQSTDAERRGGKSSEMWPDDNHRYIQPRQNTQNSRNPKNHIHLVMLLHCLCVALLKTSKRGWTFVRSTHRVLFKRGVFYSSTSLSSSFQVIKRCITATTSEQSIRLMLDRRFASFEENAV